MPGLLEQDIELDGNFAFEQQQINGVIEQLEEYNRHQSDENKRIPPATINDVRTKLESSYTARYDHPAFTITRGFNGYAVEFHDHRKAA